MASPGTWTFSNNTRTKILDGSLRTGNTPPTFKVALFNSSWSTSTTSYSTTNELSTANGYTQGGTTAASPALSGTTTVTLKFTDVSWTASGGTIVARYAVLYETTGNNIYAYLLLDSAPADVTTADGNSLKVDLSTNGILSLA